MIYTKVTKMFLCILLAIVIIACGGYWFFTKTNRGSSWTLYTFAGWRAPLKVKLSCASETDTNVSEKFKLPLKFDEKTKNELRGFWYYSYYRECLFKNGYDFSGNVIPRSTIGQDSQNKTIYTNSFIGINFSISDNTTITTDNELNVDFDDRLYVSKLLLPEGELTINAYKKADDPELLARLKDGLVITLPDKTIVNLIGDKKILNTISLEVIR